MVDLVEQLLAQIRSSQEAGDTDATRSALRLYNLVRPDVVQLIANRIAGTIDAASKTAPCTRIEIAMALATVLGSLQAEQILQQRGGGLPLGITLVQGGPPA